MSIPSNQLPRIKQETKLVRVILWVFQKIDAVLDAVIGGVP